MYWIDEDKVILRRAKIMALAHLKGHSFFFFYSAVNKPMIDNRQNMF